jgi:hypothetical protein
MRDNPVHQDLEPGPTLMDRCIAVMPSAMVWMQPAQQIKYPSRLHSIDQVGENSELQRLARCVHYLASICVTVVQHAICKASRRNKGNIRASDTWQRLMRACDFD